MIATLGVIVSAGDSPLVAPMITAGRDESSAETTLSQPVLFYNPNQVVKSQIKYFYYAIQTGHDTNMRQKYLN